MGELSEVRETLRALVRVACERAAHEPRPHVRLLLAEHAEADAASVAALAALGVDAGRAVAIDGIADAYELTRPALAEAVARIHDAIDPLTEQPLLAVLVGIRHDQERHVVELPVSWSRADVELPGDDEDLHAQAQAALQRVRSTRGSTAA